MHNEWWRSLVHDYRILQMLKMLNLSIVSMDWVHHVHTFYLWRNVVCLFCLFVMLRSPKPYDTSCIVEKPLMSKSAMSWFHNVFDICWRRYWILNKISFKSKLKFKRGLWAHSWYCLESPWWVGFNEGFWKIKWLETWEILNFE
jgi:hypothetical protein